MVRWMIRHDRDAVAAIEALAFPDPWSPQDIDDWLRGRRNVAVVAMLSGHQHPVASLYYTIRDRHYQIVSLAVNPKLHRRGVGRVLVSYLKRKLTPDHRYRLTAYVRSTNVPAQMFFGAVGFRATRELRDYYDLGCGRYEDAYEFVFRLDRGTEDVAAAKEARAHADG